MALSLQTIDRQAKHFTMHHHSPHVQNHLEFLAQHRYRLRQPRQVGKLLPLRNLHDYLARKIFQQSPQWMTVVSVSVINGRPRLLVRLEFLPHKIWSAPYLPAAPGDRVRGWLTFVDPDTQTITSFASIRIVWRRPFRKKRPSDEERLICEFFAHKYPALQVQHVLRVPGIVTWVLVTTTTAAGRNFCYSPRLRQRLQTLFYQTAGSIPETFRVVLANQPLTTQIAHLLGLLPEQVRQDPGGVCDVWTSGTRVRMLAPLVAQFLHCKIRMR